MNLQILAQNIRQLRVAKQERLSQKGLADAAGLSLPAIKKLEGGKVAPRMNTVQAIANALGVKLQDLFYPVNALKTVRFRSSKKMQNRQNIIADIGRRLDDFNFLEDTLGESTQFKLEKLRNQIDAGDIVGAAKLCRKALKLREGEPIHDICGLLEDAGIKVFPVSIASDSFFGLAIGEQDGGPAVAVNSWDRIPVERRIFSAAHELGHLLMHLDAFDISQTEENKEEEEQANLFAGHFLMPDAGFIKEWNEAAGLAFVDRVFKVKRIFGVSYKTILVRLIEHGAVDRKNIWPKFYVAYKQKYRCSLAYKEEPESFSEPFKMVPFGFYEDRLSRLTRKAIERDKISLSRGAEILRLSISEMQELLVDWSLV